MTEISHFEGVYPKSSSGHHHPFGDSSPKVVKPAEICHKLDLGHRRGSPLFASIRDTLGAKVGAR